MMTYALGRGLQAYDRRTVDNINRTLAADGYRFQTLDSADRGKSAVSITARGRGSTDIHDSHSKALPRRTFLKGMGTAVALPFLDAMIPAAAKAQSASDAMKPVRMAFVYVPNGIDMRHWNPSYEGELQELPRTLKPLEPFRKDITLLGNLTHNTGRALLDGAGDHGRCAGSYLTGVQVKKTVVDIKASVSCDQLVANEIGKQTRFPSLEVGLEDARQAGDCDSGYSCAYTNNLAWRNETQPLPPILDPRSLFDRLFGEDAALSPEARAQKNKYRRSILDFISAKTRERFKALLARRTSANSTSISARFATSSCRSKRRRKITPRSIRTWKSRTAFLRISPNTSS